MSGSFREACQISESGRKAIPNVWERSGGTLECRVVFGRPSPMTGIPFRMFRSGQVSVQDVREWSGGPPG